MATSITSRHLCSICGKDVPLEQSKTDEQGKTVHEECLAARSSQLRILSGWKEIAKYLGKGVRTVQRYERIGLPIRRPVGQSSGTVIAREVDLAGWVSTMPVRGRSTPKTRTVYQQSNKLRADFLRIDSEIGLTLSSIALTANNPEKKRRTTESARLAYDAIKRLREDVDLSDEDRKGLDVNVARLKTELKRLGQNF